jgi:uncharacterized protein YdcH (DUF465 family)
MPITSQDIRQSLLARDPEFRNLVEEHSRCESQLEQIVKSFYLSSEDLIQEAELKKLKLRLKDRMELILARHQQMVSH